ncbi:MAG: helix-turn-helix domain-containing protein [Waltera sp.]
MLFLCGGGKISAGYRNHGKVRVKHMTQIDKNIAFNLKRIRKSKNMSLDMLAERTGVSKSIVGTDRERRIQSHGVHYREDRGGIEGTF